MRLGPKRLLNLNQRQISASKIAPIPPISALALEEFENDTSKKPLKGIMPNFS